MHGTVAEADFAADLAQVVTGGGSPEYVDPVRFFANTYPTRGLKSLLANVCRRLSGAGGEAAAIFRLDTSYGGGKTHGLIALAHAARGLPRVAGMDEFIDASLLPKGPVRLAAFDGENADPANGRTMGEGVRAHTPWGELAYALAGAAGYDRVRNSDTGGVAPGADTLRELFGGEPTLILLDELSVYLRKVQQSGAARDQLTAFLTSLFKAVEATPRAALVYTLAIGKEGRAVDAYSVENQFIADRMAEAESVSARKATLLNPTEEDETPQVLRRRLFEFIDDDAARDAVADYQAVWSAKREAIADDATRPETAEAFQASYPLHPEVLQTLTSKTATLDTFQRVRGMLRLLARTIAQLWETRPADATAIHLHHVDPGCEPVRQEIVTRLQQSAYVPAIANDVAGSGGARMAAIFAECRRVLKPDGVMTLMFTHKATGAWDALTTGLIEAGFVITASWPVNTEAEDSLHIRDKAAANSTIFLVCRPRATYGDEAPTAYWEDVEPAVASAVRTRVAEFQDAGIGGVDLYLASFGPALEEFSRHWPLRRGTPRQKPELRRQRQRVLFEEPWDPYAVTPEDALDAARREVKRWRLSQLTQVKADDDLDPLTAFFVLAWDAFKAPVFAYDEALRLARAVGVDLEGGVVGRVAGKKASDLHLRDSARRAAAGALGPADGSRGMIDALHHAAHAARGRSVAVAAEMLARAGLDREPRFFVALEAVLEILPPSKTFTGIALEGAVEASGSDFEALYNLYRLAYDDRIDEPDQLRLWREES